MAGEALVAAGACRFLELALMHDGLEVRVLQKLPKIRVRFQHGPSLVALFAALPKRFQRGDRVLCLEVALGRSELSYRLAGSNAAGTKRIALGGLHQLGRILCTLFSQSLGNLSGADAIAAAGGA